MILEIKNLMEEGIIDNQFSDIILKIKKEARHELDSTILIRNGILRATKCNNYLNKQAGNLYTYELHEEETQMLEFSNYINDKLKLRTFMDICNEYKIFPYKIIGNVLLWIAQERPSDKDVFQDLKDVARTLSMQFNPPYNKIGSEVRFMLKPIFESTFIEFCSKNKLGFNTGDLYKPMPELQCEFYIIKGVLKNASDIFFDPKSNGVRVSYSILNDYLLDDLLLYSNEEKARFLNHVIKLCGVAPKDRSVDNVVEDLSIKNLADIDNKYNGRVNLFLNGKYDASCIRVVDKSKKAIPFDRLNIRQSRKDIIKQLCYNNSGMVLVAGTTGSGKSTTVSSKLKLLNDIRPFDRIETVEDPIEQVNESISQLTLEGSGATYADVARALTRRNAKILFIGEFNSPVTIRFGVNATLQNLFIISTIHSIDAGMIPDRIRGMTTEDPSCFEQFLQVVRGLVYQTMLKEACPNCLEHISREDYRITNDMNQILDYYRYREKTVPIAVPKHDCELCEGRGFLIDKPIIAVEVCPVDDSLREDIISAPHGKIYKIIYEHMRINNYTGVQDALDYMNENKLDWFQIWSKFSLFNKVSSAIMEGDEKYQQTSYNSVIK